MTPPTPIRRRTSAELYSRRDEPSPGFSKGRSFFGMTRLTTILIMIARLLGVAQIVTGFAFWFGWMPNTAPHFGMGSLLVLVVWIIALIGLFALPKRGVPLITLLWGGLVLW